MKNNSFLLSLVNFLSYASILLVIALVATPLFARPTEATTEIYDDTFVQASHLELAPFLAKYKPTLVSKQKRTNAYAPKQVDYLVTYALGTDRFVFYKTPGKTLILSFAATSNKLKLARNVKVDMSQQAFEAAFKKKLVGHIATVTETEAFELYTFEFDHHVLTKITYQCRID